MAFIGKKHSVETRQKISQKLLGRKHSAETRRKMSEAKLGEKAPLYGKVGGNHPRSHPQHQEAKDVFLKLLSSDMPMQKIRKLLYERFENIKQNTICVWIIRWQRQLANKGQ